MIQTQKWLRNVLLCSAALGVIGFIAVSQADAAGQHRYSEHEWRSSHPHWNGHYYWHNHSYYYDQAYSYPAVVDNEWSTIGGGVVLDRDPYVGFSGSYGSYYPTTSLNIDLGSSDRNRHARAQYFQRPNFWRDGTRYDRTTVTHNGTRSYRFVRHSG